MVLNIIVTKAIRHLQIVCKCRMHYLFVIFFIFDAHVAKTTARNSTHPTTCDSWIVLSIHSWRAVRQLGVRQQDGAAHTVYRERTTETVNRGPSRTELSPRARPPHEQPRWEILAAQQVGSQRLAAPAKQTGRQFARVWAGHRAGGKEERKKQEGRKTAHNLV